MRYVVLHHEGFGEPHYDFMVESSSGSALMTWRAIDWPPVAGDILTRIGDHRRDYLDYEGPVSNNRGNVRRVASGTCEVASQENEITFDIIKPQRMQILIRCESEDRWKVVEVEG